MARYYRMCFGLKILLDRCGLLCSSFVLFIWSYGHAIVFLPILVPQYEDNNISVLTIASYLILSINTLVAFFRAMFSDPGKVANVKKEEVNDISSYGLRLLTFIAFHAFSPKVDWRTWEKCVRCCSPRPPRSHHCSKCGVCVKQMDHHCQWINNCVGEKNFWIFHMLLFYAFLFVNFNILLYHFHLWGWMGNCKSCTEVTWIDPLSYPMKHISYFIAALAFTGITLLLLLTNVHASMGMSTIEALEDPSAMMSKVQQQGKFFPKREVITRICRTRNIFSWINPYRKYDDAVIPTETYTV